MVLTIHFLNVGHGDCTFIEFPDRLTMVDVNNSKNLPDEVRASMMSQIFSEATLRQYPLGAVSIFKSRYEDTLVDPMEYYKAHFRGLPIFRYIQTHPDMDHMSGLNRMFGQEKVPLINFWDTDHNKTMSDDELDQGPYDKLDWWMYRVLRAGLDIDNNQLPVLRLTRGALGDFYSNDGISILSPTAGLVSSANASGEYNELSYVLSIQYGDSKIVLGGDALESSWEDIYSDIPEALSGVTLLKASHHGRRSGYHQASVKTMSPDHTIVSVGQKPDTDASHLYRQFSNVFSTRYHGTITAKCWYDGDTWLYDSKGSRIDR